MRQLILGSLLLLSSSLLAAERGSLVVHGPKGATIHLDGEKKGTIRSSKKGRAFKRLPAGEVLVEIRHDEFVSFAGPVRIHPDGESVVWLPEVSLPTEEHGAPEGLPPGLAARFTSQLELIEAADGDEDQLEAIAAGLGWLARHQARDGSWSVEKFDEACGSCDGAGSFKWADPGITGLTLLAFLGAAHTTEHGDHHEVVRRGILYLRTIQTEDGCVGPKNGHFIYNHAIATIALCEASACASEDADLRAAAVQALEFLESARNPGLAWRYSVQPRDNDTSVTSWCAQALYAGTLIGIQPSDEALAGTALWLDKVTDPKTARTGYRAKGDPGARLAMVRDLYDDVEALTAAAIAARTLLCLPTERGETTPLGLERVVTACPDKRKRPDKRKVDRYFWYQGSTALALADRGRLEDWNAVIAKLLLETQETEGTRAGSWNVECPWGPAGGRVYSTAISVLTLEAPFRLIATGRQ